MALTNNAQASSSRHPIRRPARVQSSPPEEEDSDEERRKKPRISRTSADGVDLDGWTIDTYKPQTLKYDARSMEKLRTVMSNIENMRERIITSLGKVIDTAKTIEECNPGDKMIEELAQGLCRSIEISEVLEIKGQILKVMTAKLEKKEEIEDAVAKYEELAGQRTEEYMKKTPRQKFADDKHYRDFREGIWSVNNESSACWPMSHWLERQEGDASDDEDDEVQVGPTMQNYRCAISHMPIEDAMVNPLCGHHYSKAHVEGLFQQHHTGRNGRQKIKCPAVGCSKDVFLRDLKEDPAFQKKADEFHQRANEEEVDDFEDISQE